MDLRDTSRSSERGNPDRSTSHRREFDPCAKRKSFTERKERALIDVAVYRTVSVRDLSNERFGGHPFTTSKAVASMVRAGWMTEHTAKGPKGRTFKVLTVTSTGGKRAEELAAKYGVTRQVTWSGMVKRSEIRHDAAVYRASQVEQKRLLARGCTVKRIRIDAEMKREVARVRARHNAAMERRGVARRLGLPVTQGHVLVPDAQIEYRDP